LDLGDPRASSSVLTVAATALPGFAETQPDLIDREQRCGRWRIFGVIT
jgi:hypothetical protein